jgi:hypothetical protein
MVQRIGKPNRKSGEISKYGKPAKGGQGVRIHHKANEEKILAHRRYGLTDETV